MNVSLSLSLSLSGKSAWKCNVYTAHNLWEVNVIFFYAMSNNRGPVLFLTREKRAIILCTWCTESTRNYFADVFPTFSFLGSRFWDRSEEQGVFVIDNCELLYKSFCILNAIIKFKRSSFISGSIYLSAESTPNSS